MWITSKEYSYVRGKISGKAKAYYPNEPPFKNWLDSKYNKVRRLYRKGSGDIQEIVEFFRGVNFEEPKDE